MSTDRLGLQTGLQPPPVHPLNSSASASSSSSRLNLPPALPPRPSQSNVAIPAEEEADSASDSAELEDGHDDAEISKVVKDEEALSEVQLLQLYDDEEIDRFLHLFSTYVREVRVAEPGNATQPRPMQEASLSTPTLTDPGASIPNTPATNAAQFVSSWDTPISERIARDLLVPLLSAHRPPLPEFSLSRLKQTSQRLYVTVEPIYSWVAIPLLRLAVWKEPKKSFAYCALYWILWYHGLLLSAVMLLLLYRHVRWKLHPYPSLAELREYRSRIDRSQHFGSILATRLAASPTLGLRDMWDLFGDYRHLRKLKKMARGEGGKTGALDGGERANDSASVPSASHSVPDLTADQTMREAEDDADLKRVGLFMMNEVADLLERVKNIFLWRQPAASAYYGLMLLGYVVLGVLPARYLVKIVGLFAGVVFWHVTPVIAAIPPSERDRIPAPLWIVPTDTEYAMELISQRVARGLAVQPKRRRVGRGSGEAASSSSVDWNKWGGRLASTKARAGEMREMLQQNWTSLNPPQSGSPARIETRTFPAQLRKNPGLMTLTETTLYFTPLFSSHASLSIPLADITAVKKTRVTQGIDVRYTDGSKEDKQVCFMLVGSRSELFARLVSSGGKKWAKV